jgi:hypothetical protein
MARGCVGAIMYTQHRDEEQSMKIRERLVARRARKAHERYLEECERQQRLQSQDVQKAVREVTTWAGGNQQGGQ